MASCPCMHALRLQGGQSAVRGYPATVGRRPGGPGLRGHVSTRRGYSYSTAPQPSVHPTPGLSRRPQHPRSHGVHLPFPQMRAQPHGPEEGLHDGQQESPMRHAPPPMRHALSDAAALRDVAGDPAFAELMRTAAASGLLGDASILDPFQESSQVACSRRWAPFGPGAV